MTYRKKVPSSRFRLPNTWSDLVAFLLFHFGGVFLLWYELFHILPTYYPAASDKYLLECYIHYIVAIFFAVNIYGNMFKLVTTETSIRRFHFFSGSLLPDGWRYCPDCDLNLPPRSHHCKLCDECILQRDHHCWFAGYCIGYHNYRYYVVMVTHMVLAGLYCNIFNLTFVVTVKGSLTLFTFLSYVAPHFGWMFGYYDKYVLCVTALTTIGTVLLFIFSWLLYIQLVQIVYGQTKYEQKKGIFVFNQGVFHNFREVFGRRWFLVFWFPWIQSPLYGDGVMFHKKED